MRQNSVYCKSIMFIPHTLCVWGYYRYNRIGWLGLLASLLESSAIWSIYKENMGCSFFCSVFNNHNSDVRPIGDDILNDEMLPAEWTWNQRMWHNFKKGAGLALFKNKEYENILKVSEYRFVLVFASLDNLRTYIYPYCLSMVLLSQDSLIV